MGWLRRTNKDRPDVKTEIAPDNTEEALRQDFRFATQGDFCRTISFVWTDPEDNLDKKEWFEAVMLPTSEWRLLRKTQVGAQADVYVEPGKHFSSFFDVVKIMAMYENAQPRLNKKPADITEADRLGPAYFRTLAKKEGLAFDNTGFPRPTLHGHILTDGFYAQSTIEDVRHAHEKKSDTMVAPAPAGSVFSGLLSIPDEHAAPHYDCSTRNRDLMLLDMREIMTSLLFLRKIVAQAVEAGWQAPSDRPGRYDSSGRHSTSIYSVMLHKDLPDAEKSMTSCLDSLFGPDAAPEKDAFLSAFLKLQAVIQCDLAKYVRSGIGTSIKSGDKEYKYETHDLIKTCDHLARTLQALGWANAHSGSALIAAMLDDGTTTKTCLRYTDNIIGWFDRAFVALHGTATQKRALGQGDQLPPHDNTLPQPPQLPLLPPPS